LSPTARPPRLARFKGRGAHRSFSHAVYLNFEFIFRIPIGELLSNGLYAIEDKSSFDKPVKESTSKAVSLGFAVGFSLEVDFDGSTPDSTGNVEFGTASK